MPQVLLLDTNPPVGMDEVFASVIAAVGPPHNYSASSSPPGSDPPSPGAPGPDPPHAPATSEATAEATAVGAVAAPLPQQLTAEQVESSG